MKKQFAVLLSVFVILQISACSKTPQLNNNIKSTMSAYDTENSTNLPNIQDTAAPNLKQTKAQNQKESINRKTSPIKIEKTDKNQNRQTITVPVNHTAPLIQNRMQYNELTVTQRKIYANLCDSLENMTSKFKIVKASADDIHIAYRAVDYDNPQYFWIPRSYSYTIGESYCTIEWEFSITREQKKSRELALESVIKTVKSVVSKYNTQYERQLYIHDYINQKVTYDYNAINRPESADAFTAYSALVRGKAVCEGYSRAYQLLLQYAGIESTLVSGQSKGFGHMWNIVKIDGSWYHNDLTWDDTGNNAYHTYFNVSEKFIVADHKIDKVIDSSSKNLKDDFNLKIPAAISMNRNYCGMNCTLIASENDIEEAIIRGFKNPNMSKDKVYEYSFGDSCDKIYNSGEIKNFVNSAMKRYNDSVSLGEKLKSGYTITGVTDSKGFKVIYNK